MLLDELIKIFKYMDNADNLMEISDLLHSKYTLFAIKEANGWFGVAIETKLDSLDFFEEFENGMLLTQIKHYRGENHKILALVSNEKESLEQFTVLCEDFLKCFNTYSIDDIFENSKCKWLEKWKNILGNTNRIDTPYFLLAELLTLNYLLNNGYEVKLTNQGTHDIESNKENFEVKSTIDRYNNEVQINSQYQLIPANGNKLNIIFVRLEQSQSGYSLNDLKDELINKNYNKAEIEKKIKEFSSSALNEKYIIHEAKIYEVNDDFPKIDKNSFKDNKIPDGIKKFEYIIDLTNVKNERIDLNY